MKEMSTFTAFGAGPYEIVDKKAREDITKCTKKRLLSFDGQNLKLDGTTQTYAQVYDMLMTAPDFVVVVYQDRAYHPNQVKSEQIIFTSTYSVNGYDQTYRITLHKDNHADESQVSVSENAINKAGVISNANEDDENQYPTVKAVAQFVKNSVDKDLSISGAAADAAVTGQRITALNQRIDELPTSGPGAVSSVNGQTGAVELSADDVGAYSKSASDARYAHKGEGGGSSGDYITPEMYGAVGDGVTDDTAAVQEAVNAAFSESKRLVFGPKTYRTTSTVVIPCTPTDGDFHMRGYGMERTVIFADGGFTAFSAQSFMRSSASHLKVKFPESCPENALAFSLGMEGNVKYNSHLGHIFDVVVVNGSGVDVLQGAYMDFDRLVVFYGAGQYGVRLGYEYVYLNRCRLSGEKEPASDSIGTGKAIWLRGVNQAYIDNCDLCAGRGYGLFFDGNHQQTNIYVDRTTFFGDFISVYANISHNIENVQITRCDMWSSRKMGPVFMFDRQSDSSAIGLMNFRASISMRGVSNYPGSVAQISDALGSYTSLGKLLEQVELAVKTPNNATVIGYDRRLFLKVNPNEVYYSKPYISVDNDYTAVVLTYYGLFPKYRTNTLFPGYCVQNDDGTMPPDVKFYWQEDGNVTKLMCKGSTTKAFGLTTKIDWDTLANATATAPAIIGGEASSQSGYIYAINANATQDGIPLTNGMQIAVWPSNTGTVELYMAGASTKISAAFTSTNTAAIFVWIATSSTAGSLINLVNGSRTYITFTAGADTVFKVVNGIPGNIVVATKG